MIVFFFSSCFSLFTFILPSAFLLGNEEKLLTREFLCRHIPFALTFVKNGDQLNAFLLHRSRDCERLEMTLDLSVTLLCREHFTRNETFIEKNCKFNNKVTLHGRKSFTSVNRLCSVEYMDERGNIQCELEIKNLTVSFLTEVQLTPQLINPQYAHVMQPNTPRQPIDAKIETPSFFYSGYEWCVVIQPKLDSVGQLGHFRMFIQRLTPCDHSVRLTYRIKLTAGTYTWDPYQERKLTNPSDSNTYEINYTDLHGLCRPYRIDRVRELLQAEGKFTLAVELKDAVSEYFEENHLFETHGLSRHIFQRFFRLLWIHLHPTQFRFPFSIKINKHGPLKHTLKINVSLFVYTIPIFSKFPSIMFDRFVSILP